MQGQPCAKQGADGRLSQDPSWQLGVMGGGWSLEEACGDPEELPGPALKAGLRGLQENPCWTQVAEIPRDTQTPRGAALC